MRSALVVLETRAKQYPLRTRANFGWKPDRVQVMRKTADGSRIYYKVKKRSRARAHRISDLGGVGQEIVRVARCCPACAALHRRE